MIHSPPLGPDNRTVNKSTIEKRATVILVKNILVQNNGKNEFHNFIKLHKLHSPDLVPATVIYSQTTKGYFRERYWERHNMVNDAPIYIYFQRQSHKFNSL